MSEHPLSSHRKSVRRELRAGSGEVVTAGVAQRFAAALAALIDRRDLATGEMSALVRDMVSGQLDDAETAALLTALRMKGETAEELAAAASVLREQMIPLETGRPDVLDTCGTGGASTGTVNATTA